MVEHEVSAPSGLFLRVRKIITLDRIFSHSWHATALIELDSSGTWATDEVYMNVVVVVKVEWWNGDPFIF